MSNGNQSWILIVVAVVGVLVIGVAFKQCGSSSQQEALRAEADRAVAVAARSDRSGWSAQGGSGQDDDATGTAGTAARAGREAGHGADDAGVGGAAGTGSAQSVRDELRRRSQQAAAAAAAAGGLKADSSLPAVAGSGREDPFKEARERMASRSGSAPLAAQVAVPGAVGDPNSSEPSETPALSVLAKEGEARDDAALVDSNSATYQAGEGHVFDSESQVRIPNAGNISGDAGSIAFELKPKWAGDDNSDASFFDLRTPNEWTNRMELVKNGPYLRFLMWDSEGNENGIGFQMKNWAADESHPIAMTWGADANGQKMMSLYVDGNLVGQRVYEHDFNVPNDQPLVIGNNVGGGLGARSILSGFQVYNKPLDSGRISGLSFGQP